MKPLMKRICLNAGILSLSTFLLSVFLLNTFGCSGAEPKVSATINQSASLAGSGSSPYPRATVPGGGCSDRGRGVSLGRGRSCTSRRREAFRVDRGEDCTAQL